MKAILRNVIWSAVAIFLGLWLFSSRACAQEPEAPHTLPYSTALPDAPQPQGSGSLRVKLVKPVGFFAFRGIERVNGKRVFNPNAPALRTNRQMFHSKLYVGSLIGGALAMIVACRNKRSGEDWASEVPAVLGVDAMAYLGGRFLTQSFAVGPGIYEMVHYSQAATK